MTAGEGTASWWDAGDVSTLTVLLAGRGRSRLWQHADPAEVARWVFGAPTPVALHPAPAPTPDDWRDGLGEREQLSWVLAGWFLRRAVPEPLATAGKHWLLSRRWEDGGWRLRLTVGPVALLRLNERGNEVRLRLALAPLHSALSFGALSDDEWEQRGIEMPVDTTKTFEDEKLLVRCPDVETALWLLVQPPVMVAARMLAARLATRGFSFEQDYRPEVAARAWGASEALPVGVNGASGEKRGFDRPYTRAAASAVLPRQRSFDADAYRAGLGEHDRLCRELIERLGRTGLQAGAGLRGQNVDVAWRDASGRQFIAEVKSLVDGNQTEQLRLGLGQLLEYRHRLAILGVPVTAVLLVTHVHDRSWGQVCAENGIILVAADENVAWQSLDSTAMTAGPTAP
ncbi:hypothetical protein [Micromonospora sp. WMMD964]|uniref:hypothetical protein n=1 Tax=Micromonospora sp. WMMD964 TaxID=3016091 RepID=UPI00249A6250|nr:hypothetical protein [Micromonospora sp. WMMD964]WFE99604.1 hypothetical protein O7616_22275 [Micromonospora sp. WMMD964]